MVSLALGKARVELAPEVGGAIAEFTFSGVDVLRRTPPAARAAGDVRAHACYPLVPYSNRIANARLAVTSGTVELARNFGDHPNSIHGVGWQRAWRWSAMTAAARCSPSSMRQRASMPAGGLGPSGRRSGSGLQRTKVARRSR